MPQGQDATRGPTGPKQRLAGWIIRHASRWLEEDERYVVLNTNRIEGPPGRVLPFITPRGNASAAMAFKREWVPDFLGEAVPARVAREAGWPVVDADV